MQPCMRMKGFTDFFLSGAQKKLLERGPKQARYLFLPQQGEKDHYELWSDMLHGNFETNTPGDMKIRSTYRCTFRHTLSGNYGFIVDLVKTLKSAYNLSPNYDPGSIETPFERRIQQSIR